MTSVRRFKEKDAPQIASLFKRSVLELGPRFYSQEQVEAWAARGPSTASVLSRNNDGRITFVSVDKADQVIAYAELEPDGHIDQVYALPHAAGTGVVYALYDEMEKHAVKLGMTILHTEASEGAWRFFLKKDFIERGKRVFEIEGVEIHNYAMDKAL